MPNTINLKFGSQAKAASVSNYSKTVLSDILKLAKEADCLITSTQRSPADQARAMYDNITFYGVSHQKSLYGPYGDQIIECYVKAKNAGNSPAEIKAGMTQKILDLGPANVSRHCSDPNEINVIDIAPTSINNKAEFEKAVLGDKRVANFLKPPADPAYHLEILQNGSPHITAVGAPIPNAKLELSQAQTKKIFDNKSIFENAQDLTGVPWQAIASIWTRESFSVAPPQRPGGQFQFDPVPSEKQLTNLLRRFTKLSNTEITAIVNLGVNVFETGAILCACFMRMKVGPQITPDSSDGLIKDAFWAYNGRAYGGADLSPYVMNGFDANHMNMIIRGTLPNPNGKGRIKVEVVDKRPGAYTAYKQLKALS